MQTYTVALLDETAPEVQALIQKVAPAHFIIQFPKSGTRSEQLDLVLNADFVVSGGAPIDAEMIGHANHARLIQKWGIGYDKIDIGAAKARGIPVAIAFGINAGPVAEHAIALMLAVYRRIPLIDRKLREGVWMKSDMRSVCFQISGKTVGLLGFGNIARMVAHRLRGFDVQILYYDVRRADNVTESSLRAAYVPLIELLNRSDIFSIHVPLTSTTRQLIDAKAIAAMKSGAVVINTSRGGILDEGALYDALQTGKLRGAGLDVFEVEPPPRDHPLFALPQVVLTPHSGGVVLDNVENVARHVFGNMQRIIDKAPLPSEDIIVPVSEQLVAHT